MKINKLIPILGLASATAMIPALATSCGNNGFVAFEYDFSDLSTVSDFVIEDRLETDEVVTDDNITRIFLTEVNKNKKILADEYVYRFLDLNPPEDVEFTGVKYNVQIGNIDPITGRMSFAIREIYIDDEDQNHLENRGDGEFFPVPIFPEGGEIDPDTREIIDFEVINLPFIVYDYYDFTTDPIWTLDPYVCYLGVNEASFASYMRSLNDWSIIYTRKVNDLVVKEYKTIYNRESTDEQMQELYNNMYESPSLFSVFDVQYLTDTPRGE